MCIRDRDRSMAVFLLIQLCHLSLLVRKEDNLIRNNGIYTRDIVYGMLAVEDAFWHPSFFYHQQGDIENQGYRSNRPGINLSLIHILYPCHHRGSLRVEHRWLQTGVEHQEETHDGGKGI